MSLGAAPQAAVIGENEGQDMPEMGEGVAPEADPLASSQGTLAPQQVIAKTVTEATASMQEQSAAAGDGRLQTGARSSQPSLIPNSQRGHTSAMNGGLRSHRVDSTTATPEKQR